MKRAVATIALALALAVCFLMGGCAGDKGSADSAITVSASATAQVVPDRASIGVTASGEGKTAGEARAAGERAAGDIAAALRSAGVPEEAISIGEVKVKERTGESEPEEVVSGYEDEWGNWIETYELVNDKRTVVGYDATVRVDASEFAVDALGQAVRNAASVGATGFESLSFTVSDRRAAYEQALAEVMTVAHKKAESLAKAGGVYVGRVVNLVEGSESEFETTVAGDASALDPDDEATLDIAVDMIDVPATATVSYAIS